MRSLFIGIELLRDTTSKEMLAILDLAMSDLSSSDTTLTLP